MSLWIHVTKNEVRECTGFKVTKADDETKWTVLFYYMKAGDERTLSAGIYDTEEDALKVLNGIKNARSSQPLDSFLVFEQAPPKEEQPK
jgi:hypothetical protein